MSTSHMAKDYATAVAKVRLRSFLQSDQVLDFTPPAAAPPRVSVVMLLYNRAEFTLSCLFSLASLANTVSKELIIVDNCSTDATNELLSRVRGATIIRNRENVGYPRGVNQGAARATGDHLLLLNNDTEILGRSIDAAVEFLDAHPDVGVVGGRIILLDGTLQEAGCLITSDGWVCQYARGRQPDDPAVLFRRDVDYCSAAFQLLRREIFESSGGFDEVFSPGYFEDPDFAIRMQLAGWRAVYLPEVAILHYENATSGQMFGQSELEKLVHHHHKIFCARHRNWLAEQPANTPESTLRHRRVNDTSIKVLLVGEPADSVRVSRTVRLLEWLDAMPTVAWKIDRTERERFQELTPPTVETLVMNSADDCERFLTDRRGYFSLAVLMSDELLAEFATVLSRHGLPFDVRPTTSHQLHAA
ncbi:glycosyltransferase family 2 protein [Limnoglobus roseus]|uniref:GT2 family glycosyltransferase n=1 Tax=Limnoglobus roseus TaxID=2598579 RepID=A0A5C1ADN3_9BACT|nr:glycosyltransferase family 2 protein [Limnoglobus roseus]QEL17479.1 GT2 family glycosyltransferase [Limnoglobus roseus]